MTIKDTKEKATSGVEQGLGMTVLYWIVGLECVGVKALNWSGRKVGVGVLVGSENVRDLCWCQFGLVWPS